MELGTFDFPVCSDCGKQYKHRKHLYEHIRNIHKKKPDTLVTRESIKCPICDQQQNNRHQVYSHLNAFHDIPFEVEKRTFKEMDEFREWKETMEKNCRSHYVLERGVKRLVDSSEKFYYHCSRSGSYEKNKLSKCNKEQNISRNDIEHRNRNTKKIGKLCPSTIEVKSHPNNGIDVMFFPTHFCTLPLNPVEFIEIDDYDQTIENISDEKKSFNHHENKQTELKKKIKYLLGICSENVIDEELSIEVTKNVDDSIKLFESSKLLNLKKKFVKSNNKNLRKQKSSKQSKS